MGSVCGTKNESVPSRGQSKEAGPPLLHSRPLIGHCFSPPCRVGKKASEFILIACSDARGVASRMNETHNARSSSNRRLPPFTSCRRASTTTRTRWPILPPAPSDFSGDRGSGPCQSIGWFYETNLSRLPKAQSDEAFPQNLAWRLLVAAQMARNRVESGARACGGRP